MFMFTYSFIFIFTPIIYGLGCFGRKKFIPSLLLRHMDAIMRPHNEANTDFEQLIKADGIVALQIQHLVILLTFGIICPILSILICMAICSTTLVWQFMIVRYVNYYHYREHFDNTPVAVVGSVSVPVVDVGSKSVSELSSSNNSNNGNGNIDNEDISTLDTLMNTSQSQSQSIATNLNMHKHIKNSDTDSDSDTNWDSESVSIPMPPGTDRDWDSDDDGAYDDVHLFVSLESPESDYRNSTVSMSMVGIGNGTGGVRGTGIGIDRNESGNGVIGSSGKNVHDTTTGNHTKNINNTNIHATNTTHIRNHNHNRNHSTLMSASEAEHAVDIECGNAWKGLRESTFVILIVSCVFYASILFDVVANSSSYIDAYVMCTICVFIPLLLWIFYRFNHR